MRHTQPQMASVYYCLMKNSAIWREMPALEGFRSTVVRCDRSQPRQWIEDITNPSENLTGMIINRVVGK
ncbi:MAG: hypothetical protein RMX65_030620 [Nostoc sp. DedQUE01]|nr:hypothetical protein [Nostoc sp. DedQUE01]